jgi:hypothetical protein
MVDRLDCLQVHNAKNALLVRFARNKVLPVLMVFVILDFNV